MPASPSTSSTPPAVAASGVEAVETQEEILADAAATAERYGLRRMGVRPPLGKYLVQVWRRRHFVRSLATSKAYAENQNTYLGQLWAVLNPTLNAIVYVLIFAFIIGARGDLQNTVAFIVIGTFMWRFFSDSLSGGSKAILGNLNLVRSLHFPRAVLPLSAVLSQLASLLPAIAVMLVFTFASGYLPNNTQIDVTWRWLLIVPATLVLFVFNTGIALMVARWTALVPDLNNVFPFVLRLLMYASGAIFPISHYVGTKDVPDFVLVIFDYQPLSLMLDIARQALMQEPGIPLDPWKWAAAGAWALATFVIGFLVFWQAEARYGRE